MTDPLAEECEGLPPPPDVHAGPPAARPWEEVGRGVGRRVAAAVRDHGLRRDGFPEAVRAADRGR